ncbi:MAG: iron-containing alcohol dehydrogenase [Candidatus Cloacimonadaceae bacterium]|nr:iron-containing alcohol dehydrogenase [Candidatus Cloacimonadota bacterium]MDY0127965.1 iron-containing alcohol dehydrogenase [Candidatus Cloacimonadaceae bacterium]MCB5254975.1 iron-containing alcohol dehydrogenase [Candidatus Cloacimonadota bacterium]MCK9178684.1 iron-containing alcohol dehydrogenase [Candidatus Cloacimonadota bacterium]MCK9242771.1 iron-containing alcohol dehydrogenase [Candidatus Cloacimonadota bacterium]
MLYLPTRIFMGSNALSEAGAYIGREGKKALIVTGRSSAHKSGVMAELLPILAKEGVQHSVFSGVCENPDLDCVMQGKAQFIREGCDFIIAIGGGSPLDAAKAISLAAANNLSENQLYDADLRKQSYSIVAIPTTHGTGSEVTQYSVLTNLKTGIKAGFGSDLIFPKLAIVDARYMLSLSSKVTLNTSMDALSHLLEGIYSTNRVPLLFPMIAQGIRLIIRNLALCLKEPDHLPAREALALSSLYGGVTIAHTSTTLQHSIGYPFTTEFGVPHGLANAMFLKQIMQFYAPALKAELSLLFDRIGLSQAEFLAWLDGFPIQLRVDLKSVDLEAWIAQILSSRNIQISPVIPTTEELRELINSVQKG